MASNGLRDVVQVKPLQYAHVRNAVRTIFDANEFDPIIRYLTYDSPNFDRTRFFLRYGMIFVVQVFKRIYMGTILTIGAGDGFVMFTPARNPHSSPLDRIISVVGGWLESFLRSFDSTEQKIRRKEYVDEIGAIVQTAFGDDVKDMVSLDSLSTAPAKQGRRYGSQLVKAITDMADTQGRSTWLVSSNVTNTGFYARCGFSIAGEFIVGASNPTWKKDPIVVRVLLRKPTRDEPRSEA